MCQLWDVCSDQEAVDYVRNTQDPQEASMALVSHALSRFSTDNLSVMIVRFDPKKLHTNTATDIGVESETTHEKGAISEVEMLVSEARQLSSAGDGASSAVSSEDLKDIQEHEEDQEPGPELTPEGQAQADRILAEKQQAKSSEEATVSPQTSEEKKPDSS